MNLINELIHVNYFLNFSFNINNKNNKNKNNIFNILMIKNDIGILFDVSGSMRNPFNSLSSKSYQTRADELTNILERICQRGNRLKNEQIRIFSLLFGGRHEKIYDFCNLLEISNNKFKKTLISSKNPKFSEKTFRNKFRYILS